MEDIEIDYAKLGLQAAKRAARKVLEQACKDNKKIPIWDGKEVVYISPLDILARIDAENVRI